MLFRVYYCIEAVFTHYLGQIHLKFDLASALVSCLWYLLSIASRYLLYKDHLCRAHLLFKIFSDSALLLGKSELPP